LLSAFKKRTVRGSFPGTRSGSSPPSSTAFLPQASTCRGRTTKRSVPAPEQVRRYRTLPCPFVSLGKGRHFLQTDLRTARRYLWVPFLHGRQEWSLIGPGRHPPGNTSQLPSRWPRHRRPTLLRFTPPPAVHHRRLARPPSRRCPLERRRCQHGRRRQ
jgi:hypothetical protein